MILVACLNPALDITHEVAAVALGTATAAAPVAGEFRSCDYTGALAAVTVEEAG